MLRLVSGMVRVEQTYHEACEEEEKEIHASLLSHLKL